VACCSWIQWLIKCNELGITVLWTVGGVFCVEAGWLLKRQARTSRTCCLTVLTYYLLSERHNTVHSCCSRHDVVAASAARLTWERPAGVVRCVWNVMAHAQKPDFVFRRNGRVHLNRQGCQFSRLLAAEACASSVVMPDTPCSEVVWGVLATHSIRQFPLHFPSRASPCAITFQLDSTSLNIYSVLHAFLAFSQARWTRSSRATCYPLRSVLSVETHEMITVFSLFPGKAEVRRQSSSENIWAVCICGDILYITNSFCKNVLKIATP
jgi:hypothetical protein